MTSSSKCAKRISYTNICPPASLTNVVALDGGLGGPEAQTDVLVPSPATFSDTLGLAALALGVQEDVRLLLESALTLDSQFGGHDRGDVQSLGVVEGCSVRCV
jgi:hypothetical protein